MEANIPGESGPPGVLDRQAGSRDAVTTLYAGHAVGLIRLAVVMLGDRPAAEEVVQEAFCGLYRHWDRLSDPSKALPYARSAVLNGCRSALRHRARWQGGSVTGTQLWALVVSCRAVEVRRGVRRGPWSVGVSAASWCRQCPGSRVPTARRGRFRPKAERADRQRRESPRAHRARLPARAAQLTPDPGSRQRARNYPRREAPGALRAPLKT